MHALIVTGVALVGLPVLLHLIMRQEPKHLFLPTFRFLKQKRRINQRKLRLRHLLLMLLRMLLIVLMCVALFQPTIVSEGFSLRGEQPVAAVLVVDTSPSMGYTLADRSGLSEARMRGLKLLDEQATGPWTALDDARARAMEILEELPANSKVAIVDTADRGESAWALTINDARTQLRNMKKPKAANQAVTRALEQAYNLFPKADQMLEAGQEPLPRLLFVFSDRTSASWDSTRVENLQALRDRVPAPNIFGNFIDVGVDKPLNVAITNIELRPQIVPAGDPVTFTVTVEGTGPVPADNALVCKVAGKNDTIKKPVKISEGVPSHIEFRLEGLEPGLHQAEVSLVAADAQMADNVRFVTFRVREPRKVLAIADEPSYAFSALGGMLANRGYVFRSAGLWRLALQARRWYSCDILATSEVADPRWRSEDFAKYEAVTLAGVDKPPENLWTTLHEYVEAGGQLVILPGDNVDGYASEGARKLMPGRFEKLVAVKPDESGIGWAWDALSYQHPLLAPFGAWQKNPGIDFVKFPPLVRRYWKVEPFAKQYPLVEYADSPNADQRSPAVLERPVGQRGKVVLLTTTWDFRRDAFGDRWNNYLESSFFFVLTNEIVRHLTGDSEDVNFNYTSGQTVLVKWPTDAGKKAFYLTGPEVLGTDSIVKRDEGQAYLRLGPERMQTAGNFRVDAEDRKWSEGFSLNPPSEESSLERIEPKSIEDLLGKDSVAPASKDLKIRDVLKGKFTQPIELFPFLMILLLLFLAFENLLANKFYRPAPKPVDG